VTWALDYGPNCERFDVRITGCTGLAMQERNPFLAGKSENRSRLAEFLVTTRNSMRNCQCAAYVSLAYRGPSLLPLESARGRGAAL
jgi:hypothetical protein